MLQVDTAIRLARIEELKEKASAAERSEDWGQALASYEAVLTLDKSIRFALQGKERSMNRKQLEERMNYYLNNQAFWNQTSPLRKPLRCVKKQNRLSHKDPDLPSSYNGWEN